MCAFFKKKRHIRYSVLTTLDTKKASKIHKETNKIYVLDGINAVALVVEMEMNIQSP